MIKQILIDGLGQTLGLSDSGEMYVLRTNMDTGEARWSYVCSSPDEVE